MDAMNLASVMSPTVLGSLPDLTTTQGLVELQEGIKLLKEVIEFAPEILG